MSTFDALTLALEEWFDTELSDLPDALRQRVERGFCAIKWDSLTADQRRSVALQLDYQHDPATEQDQQYWCVFFERVDTLKKQIAEWEVVATPTAAELSLKETRIAELKQELARMDAQKRLARGDYFPERKPSLDKDGAPVAELSRAIRYVAYPKAMQQLTARLDATPEELAAWLWLGPKDGGIVAYLNANELDPPPRFFYTTGGDSQDYIEPLMACWFKVDEIDHFEPTDRYITGAALIERWGQRPGLHALAFIQAKIAESRLLDIHPIYGGTRGASDEQFLPPLESGLFPLSQVKEVETADFSDVGQPEVPIAPVQKPIGHENCVTIEPTVSTIAPTRERGRTAQGEVRKLQTQKRHTSWQKAYRKSKKEYPGKSDVWHAQQITKMEIGRGVSQDTIRKNMKVKK